MAEEVIEIKYTRAKFHRRLFANLVDILIFALLFVGCFIGFRSLVVNSSTYKTNEAQLVQIKRDSGIFINDPSGALRDVITVYNNDEALSMGQKKSKTINAINSFHNYVKEVCSNEIYQMIMTDYDEFRLEIKEGNNYYFILENGEIKETGDFLESKYYQNVYAKYVDKYCQAYLIKYIPSYYDLTKYMSNMLIFVEIAPSYLIAGILTYLIPPLIFRKGKKTLGKALYKIGLVDSRLLNCTYPRFFARFAIFYFGELILSLLSFGLPYIVSFSIMVFSKKKQGFPDYMLGLQEIDTSKTKIYNSMEEIQLDQITPHRKPVDFTSVIKR